MMQMRTGMAAVLFAGCTIALGSSLSCDRQPDVVRTSRLGVEPVELSSDAMDKTDEARAIVDWAKHGYRGMVLLYAGDQPPLGSIPDGKLERLRLLITSRNWDLLQREIEDGRDPLVDGSNYLSAAIGAGLISEVYWVIPFPFFESAGGGKKARQFLEDRGIVERGEAADAFGMKGMCIRGVLREAQVTICDPGTMHLVREAVLLDVDERFISTYSQGRDIGLLEGFKRVLDALFQREYRIAAARIVLSHAMRDDFDPASLYIISQMRETFRDPSILRQEEPPPLWRARDEGYGLLRERKFQKAWKALQASVRTHGPDEGLRALIAVAAAQRGRYDEARVTATALCVSDRRYCRLLDELAQIAEGKGRADAATAFRNAQEPFRKRSAGEAFQN